MTHRRARRRTERGMSAAVELVLLIPVIIIMAGLIVGGARLWAARTAMVEAARAGARAASLERDAGSAQQIGRQVGESNLARPDLHCGSPRVTVDTRAFGAPVGRPATVTATAHCTLDLGDLIVPGLPAAVDLTVTGDSALDTYRGRTDTP